MRDADVAQIVGAVISTLQEVQAALTPIIGGRGVAALLKRSRHLTAQTHPWLANGDEGEAVVMGLAALQSLLGRQTSVDADAGGHALLQTFYDLLATLVGSALTRQLLGPVWANSFSGTAAQDTTR